MGLNGFAYLGGRRMSINGQPGALLFYRDTARDGFALLLWKAGPPTASNITVELSRPQALRWNTGAAHYLLTNTSSDSTRLVAFQAALNARTPR